MKSEKSFKATLEIIGINPFVFVPEEILLSIFERAGKDKSPIAVKGFVNGNAFNQNLMKYLGEWRLYINLKMLENSPKRIGEIIEVSIDFEDEIKATEMPSSLQKALNENPDAKLAFEKLIPSRQKELKRYIINLKTEKAVEKNIQKIISYLLGQSDFFGKKI